MAKYPRTPHLPFSPGASSDDKMLSSVDHLLNVDLVVTEKMDGSNTTLEKSACFARSHAGAPTHPSFDQFKALHASLKNDLPDGLSFYGEWCFAKHSIEYSKLPAYFMLFGVKVDASWLSWSDVCDWAALLNLTTVPVVAKSVKFKTAKDLEKFVSSEAVKPSLCGGKREGLVLRLLSGYADCDFQRSIAKWVREGHVTTSEHWKNQAITKNTVSL